MLLNCGVGEDPWESLGQQRDPTSSSERKSTLNIHWKDWCWRWNSNTLATWYEELTHWKRPQCCERLKAGGEGDNRGWEGWMASPTRCTWVWVSSTSCWQTGKPSVLQSIGLQRVRHNWATEQQDEVNPVRSPLMLQRYNLETPWSNNGCYEAIPDVSSGLLVFLFNKSLS